MTARECKDALHLIGIALATLLAIAAIVSAGVCERQSLSPQPAYVFAAAGQNGLQGPYSIG